MSCNPIRWFKARLRPFFLRQLSRFLVHQYTYAGDIKKLHVAPTAVINNAFFNLYSGSVTIEDHAFFGYHVSLLTGTHDYTRFGKDRMNSVPEAGRDIIVETGAWLGTNATILGPCVIGAHAVVAAGAVVTKDVPPYTIVAGVPARVVKTIPPPAEAH